MNDTEKRSLLVGLLGVGAVGGAGIAGLLSRRQARANLRWVLRSWIRPANRDAHWQQRAGRRIDPWDRLLHGDWRRTGNEPAPQSRQAPTSLGR